MITTTDEAIKTARENAEPINAKVEAPEQVTTTDEAVQAARADYTPVDVKETHPDRAPMSTDEAREFARIDKDNK